MSTRPSFFNELKRRNVYKVGAAYAVAGWLLVQVITQVFPIYEISAHAQRIFVGVIVAGFPVALLLAWLFDITPQGLVRTDALQVDDEIPQARRERTGADHRLNYGLGALLLLAIAFVMSEQAGLISAGPTAPEPTATAEPSIAVLPFVNESGDKDQQYFSDGLSEDLITALSQSAGLRVIGRSSSFRFRESHEDAKSIGALLGVAHLLEGSVRRVGDVVRINAALVAASDGRTLWSQHYDRPYVDLFKLQDEITASVAVALQAKLTPAIGAVEQSDRPPSGNLEAYNAFLLGRQFSERFTAEDQPKAIASYERAVSLDPQYAQAYVALSFAWHSLGANFVEGTQAASAHEKGRAALKQALALQPDLAEAHSRQAMSLMFDEHDWKAAEEEARRAVKLSPKSYDSLTAMGLVLMATGRAAEAVEQFEAARADDPLRHSSYLFLAMLYAGRGDLEAAERSAQIGLNNQPTDGLIRFYLIAWQILRGGSAVAQRTAAQTPSGDWQVLVDALVAQTGTDRAAADAALDAVARQQGGTAAYQIAEIYALRHQPDGVFTWLDHALNIRDPGLVNLLSDPLLAPYRGDPRFAALCSKLHLPLPSAKA